MATEKVTDLRQLKKMPEPTIVQRQQAIARKRPTHRKVTMLMRAKELAEFAHVSASTVTRWKQGWTGEPLKFEGPGEAQTVDLDYFIEWRARNSGRKMINPKRRQEA